MRAEIIHFFQLNLYVFQRISSVGFGHEQTNRERQFRVALVKHTNERGENEENENRQNNPE